MGLFGTIIKYGLPASFLHCTIYQQDIWREGDDQLPNQQKRSFKCVFGMIDRAIAKTANTFNLPYDDTGKTIVSKFENLNFKNCWNDKVKKSFSIVDLLVNRPSYAACLLYRKIQPYVESPHKSKNSS